MSEDLRFRRELQCTHIPIPLLFFRPSSPSRLSRRRIPLPKSASTAAMERKRLELARSGFNQLFPIRPPAAPGHAQTLPPLPPTPEFLNKNNSPIANTRPQDKPVAGPSSTPLDEPANAVVKESPSAKPSPPPSHTFPPPLRPSEGPRATPVPPRISCEGWNISELCGKYLNFHEVRRVKALTVQEDLSRIMDEY